MTLIMFGCHALIDLHKLNFIGSRYYHAKCHPPADRFKANPQRVYEALLDANLFSAFTGAPAEIDRQAGGVFSCFGGTITGRNIEVVPNERIVQAWRVKIWPEGMYSIVAFELQPHGSGTRLNLTHGGFPDEMRAHLNGDLPDGGWHRQYWEPLAKYLS